MGIPADQAEAWLAAAQAQDADDDDIVRVLPQNSWAVQVFCCCQWQMEAGATQMIHTGIASSEVIAVCDLLGVPQADRARVLFGVRTLVNESLPEMNHRG